MHSKQRSGAVARLERRLPESRFPAGVTAPTIAVLVLLGLLTGMTAILVRVPAEPGPPAAAVEAQQRLTTATGNAIGNSATAFANDLRTLAAQDIAIEQSLPRILGNHASWRGIAVLDANRAPVAAAGRPLQLTALPATITAPVLLPLAADGSLPVLAAIPMSAGRILVAAAELRPLGVDLDSRHGEILAFGTASGTVVLSRGAAPDSLSNESRTALNTALRQGAANQSGAIPAGEGMLVAYAPVTSGALATPLGFGAAALFQVADEDVLPTSSGLVAALALFAVSMLVAAVLLGSLVVPLRRLRADALTVASGGLGTKVRTGGPREVRRIAQALAWCQASLRAKEVPAKNGGRALPAVVAVTLAALLVLSWSVWVLLAFGRSDATVPEAVLRATRAQAEATAEGVQRSLNDAVADVGAAAALGDDPAVLRPVLEAMIAGNPRYRSVYLAGADGVPVVRAGREPMRTTAPLPAEAGLRQDNTSGRLPVVYASAPVPGKDSRLVAEVDIDHLITLLHRGTGEVRLVDDGWRTIADTHGYLAFEPLTEPALRTTTEKARDDATSAVGEVAGSRSVVTAAPVAGGSAGKLGWKLVQHQRAGDLSLAGNDIRRGAQLVALLGIGTAALLFGWHYFVVVVPLRRIAGIAGRMTGHGRAEVIYPERADQIGTIASCLELCRQAVETGARRLGRDRRPRGAATDRTRRLQPVSQARRARRPRAGHGM